MATSLTNIGALEGDKLGNNLINNCKSALIGTIKLITYYAANFILAIRELGTQYGYDVDFKNCLTVQTVAVAGHKEWYADTYTRNAEKKANVDKRNKDTSTPANKLKRG